MVTRAITFRLQVRRGPQVSAARRGRNSTDTRDKAVDAPQQSIVGSGVHHEDHKALDVLLFESEADLDQHDHMVLYAGAEDLAAVATVDRGQTALKGRFEHLRQ